jgi:hypothetical protein
MVEKVLARRRILCCAEEEEEDIQGSRFSYIAESKDHALPGILFKAEGGIYCFGPIVADPRVPFSQKAPHQDAKKDCLLFLISKQIFNTVIAS